MSGTRQCVFFQNETQNETHLGGILFFLFDRGLDWTWNWPDWATLETNLPPQAQYISISSIHEPGLTGRGRLGGRSATNGGMSFDWCLWGRLYLIGGFSWTLWTLGPSRSYNEEGGLSSLHRDSSTRFSFSHSVSLNIKHETNHDSPNVWLCIT